MDNVIIAYANHDAAQKIKMVLKSGGLAIQGVCASGSQVLDLASRLPDGGVIVSGLRLNDMMATHLLELLPQQYELLLLLTPSQMAMHVQSGISCLSLPINRADLIDSVHMILTTGGLRRERQPRKAQEPRPQRSAEDVANIQKAKELLMERNHLSEAQAHRFIQKKSMDAGKKMEETAKLILERY